MASKQRIPNENKQTLNICIPFVQTLESHTLTFSIDIHFGKWHFGH
jgi:hypothetical protein